MTAKYSGQAFFYISEMMRLCTLGNLSDRHLKYNPYFACLIRLAAYEVDLFYSSEIEGGGSFI